MSAQGQTSVTVDSQVATAGLHQDSSPSQTVNYVCSEDIPFGCMVELSGGQVRRMQTASAVGTVLGAALKDFPREAYSGGYKSGDVVKVLRKGRVWMLTSGTAPTGAMTAPNFASSSTVATNRGTATQTATSASSGVEIYAAPSGVVCVKVDTSTSLALVELNLS